MLERLLPAGAVVAASSGDLECSLYPEEERLIERVVAARRREFATARACARRALARLGVPPQPILAGPSGEPLWPAGIVGSITHCEGLRACAVARAGDLGAIGIDAEPDLPLPDGVLEAVARPEERERLRELGAQRPEVNWDRLLFSIKESVYKAWFPGNRRWLDFDQASVLIDAARDDFSVRLLVPDADPVPARLHGRWLSTGKHLVSAVTVPAHAPDDSLLR